MLYSDFFNRTSFRSLAVHSRSLAFSSSENGGCCPHFDPGGRGPMPPPGGMMGGRVGPMGRGPHPDDRGPMGGGALLPGPVPGGRGPGGGGVGPADRGRGPAPEVLGVVFGWLGWSCCWAVLPGLVMPCRKANVWYHVYK